MSILVIVLSIVGLLVIIKVITLIKKKSESSGFTVSNGSFADRLRNAGGKLADCCLKAMGKA